MRVTGLWASLRALVYWGVLLLAVAAITHLVAVLELPRHSPDDAYARLARIAKGATMTPMPGPSAAGPLPGQDPALASTFCLYDLRKGPVRVGLDVSGADFAMLAVYSRHGQVLYGLTNRSAVRGRLGLAIVTADQAAAQPKPDEASALGKVRVESGDADGIVLAQALATAPSAARTAEAVAARLTCGPDAAQPLAANGAAPASAPGSAAVR